MLPRCLLISWLLRACLSHNSTLMGVEGGVCSVTVAEVQRGECVSFYSIGTDTTPQLEGILFFFLSNRSVITAVFALTHVSRDVIRIWFMDFF